MQAHFIVGHAQGAMYPRVASIQGSNVAKKGFRLVSTNSKAPFLGTSIYGRQDRYSKSLLLKEVCFYYNTFCAVL